MRVADRGNIVTKRSVWFHSCHESKQVMSPQNTKAAQSLKQTALSTWSVMLLHNPADMHPAFLQNAPVSVEHQQVAADYFPTSKTKFSKIAQGLTLKSHTP